MAARRSDADDRELGLRSSEHDASVMGGAIDQDQEQGDYSAPQVSSDGTASGGLALSSDSYRPEPQLPRTTSSLPRVRTELFEDHVWEDVHQPAPRHGFTLAGQRWETIVVFLLDIVGIVLMSVGFSRAASDDSTGAVALCLVGVLALVPGIYFTVQLYRAWKHGYEFRIFNR